MGPIGILRFKVHSISIGERWGCIMSIKEPWRMLGNVSEVNHGGKASSTYFLNAHILSYLCIFIELFVKSLKERRNCRYDPSLI